MGSYVLAVWRCRYFWLSLVRMDLRTRYRRSILGIGWSLLHPIAMTAILCAAFHSIFDQPVRTFAPYVLTGMACWNYICSVTMTGCSCFLTGETYIRQYPAPLAIYPLRTVLGGTIHFLISLGVVLALAFYCRATGPVIEGQEIYNPWVLLTLLPAMLLLFLATWSLALLAGFSNVLFQDTQHLSEIGFQILFYLTPVIYTPAWLSSHSLGRVMDFNPISAFLHLFRDPILYGHVPDAATYRVALATVALLLGTALLMLNRLQKRLIFYL
jgi:ABC-type polysaccharide/polyol phosphate export permease